MRANLPQREPKMLAKWDELDLYAHIRKACAGRPRYLLLDGPPYANGKIHIGHAVNKTLKDIIVRARTLAGFDAPYVPGWDCHGLPIELEVEKKYGRAGGKLDATAFRKACRAFAHKQIDGQRDDFIRLGVVGDWTKPYLTMQPSYEAQQLRVLAKIIERGHLYKGYKPVHWCMDCRSALAEAEVEYADKTSPAIDVAFGAVDPTDFYRRIGMESDGAAVQLPIWTTTPWTLPANQAVAVHAELDYVLLQVTVEAGVQRIVAAEALSHDLTARIGATDVKALAHFKGDALKGMQLKHPYLDRVVPVITGDHVTTDAGTGLVHTAPGHGQEDFAVGKEFDLPLENPVGDNGCFKPGTPFFEGEHVLKANEHVIEVLRDHGALLHHEAYQHQYPHCWRHKTPVIFRATPQWFVSMHDAHLRRDANDAIDQVEWLPDWGKQRILGMVDGRPDWCISRQRIWGVPIAVFVHKDTDELHPRTVELLGAVAEQVEQGGLEVWQDITTESMLGDEAADYRKVTDTMDVWFDSGSAHSCTPQDNAALAAPADLYLEGSDQHRGWFQSSLLTSVAMSGEAPYKTVLTHGFTVDEHGKKMSKSEGNVIPPQKVFSSLGADILRLWVAASDYRNEMSVSEEILKRMADSYRRIRNTARFLLGNLDGFDPVKDALAPADMLAIDRWAVARAQELQTSIAASYDTFEFHKIYQRLHNFCVTDMGGLYLDVLKDRLYTTGASSIARRSAQTALMHIAEAMVRWLAPIMPFTAEEIWASLAGERDATVMTSVWYEFPEDATPPSIDWATLIDVRAAVSKELEALRASNAVGSSLEAEVVLYADSKLVEALAGLGDELRFFLITSVATVMPADARQPESVAAGEELADRLWISTSASTHEKCQRCWHRRADVGADSEHPGLCGRCVVNVVGDGEKRAFV
ncbi:MAG: isoleucine--tRNA ligase [Gammaproteobacteria bacterium]